MLAEQNRRILALERRVTALIARLEELAATPWPPGPLQERLLQRTRVELDRALLELREEQDRRLLLLGPLGFPPVLGWYSRHEAGAAASPVADYHAAGQIIAV